MARITQWQQAELQKILDLEIDQGSTHNGVPTKLWFDTWIASPIRRAFHENFQPEQEA